MFNQDDEMQRELMGRIGVTQSQSPLEMLKNADEALLAGNHHEAQKLYNQVIETTRANSIRYLDQKQHRAAAEELFSQARAFEKLENTSERDKTYHQVVESLMNASKTAINFGENSRGITYVTLAGLTCLMFNDEAKAFEIYNQGVEAAKDKPEGGSLTNLLYSLGYLLDGLKNTNIAALADAQNFISTDLKPMLSGSKLLGFEPLLNTIVDHTRKIIELKVKLPKIQISTSVPGDLLFNQTYKFNIEMTNEGDGAASTVSLKLKLPEEFELIDGQLETQYEKIEPSQNLKHEISFRYLNSEAYEEIRQITGTIEYIDMLQNSRKQQITSLDLEFRSTSKASEYEDKLTSVLNEFPLIKEKSTEEFPRSILTGIEDLNKLLETNIKESLDEEKFEIAESSITLFQKVMDWEKLTITPESRNNQIVMEINSRIDQIRKEINDEIWEKATVEKEAAIVSNSENLKAEFSREKETMEKLFQSQKSEAINSKVQELEEKFNIEKKNLLDEHEKEKERLAKTFENRVKQQLADQETSLRAEKANEIQKKNDEIESAIREIQSDHQKELQEELEKQKMDLLDKYQKEKDEAIAQHEVQHKYDQDQISELEKQITDLRRLLKEKEDRLTQQETELRDLQASN